MIVPKYWRAFILRFPAHLTAWFAKNRFNEVFDYTAYLKRETRLDLMFLATFNNRYREYEILRWQSDTGEQSYNCIVCNVIHASAIVVLVFVLELK